MRKNSLPIGLSSRWIPITILIMTVICLAGCGSKEAEKSAPGALVMDQVAYEAWEIALVEMRIEKNEQFSAPESSPLPVAEIAGFDGLNYYFPKAELRFRTPFIAEAGTDTVSLTKRKGNVVPYIRRGKVQFSYGGGQHTLPVFGPVDTSNGNYLWLPYSDLTTGKETYGGGRYLDITLDTEGMVDLDFNYSYNPLCDYNPEKYNCTLPPAESKLDFAVEAGEMSFHTTH